MSSISFASESTTSTDNKFVLFPPSLKTNLELPACQWNEDRTICSRTVKEEALVLEIYLGYSLGMKHRKQIENILKFDSTIFNITEKSLLIAETSIDDAVSYSDHLIDQVEDKQEQVDKEKKRGTVLSIGTGIGGFAVGIIFGFLVGWLAI